MEVEINSEPNFFQGIPNHRKTFIVKVVADFYITVM